MKRIIAIGDIHGTSVKLATLLERLAPRKGDRLIFLGDYIDRGADSCGVIQQIIDLKRNGYDIVALLGNHEKLLLDYAQSPDEGLIPYLRQHGIENTLKSYGEKNLRRIPDLSFMPVEHRRFLKNLKTHHVEGKYLFVHAGIRPGKPLQEQTISDFCEIRDVFLEESHSLDYLVVFGHTPFEFPLVTGNKIGIDTGAVYGHLLTALVLPDMEFIHA